MNNTITFESLSFYCDQLGWYPVRYAIDMLVLVTGTAANMALLLMFLKDKTSSASKVLGLNLVVTNLIFLLSLPVVYVMGFDPINSLSRLFSIARTLINACFMVHLVGSPLLLGCMCVERYLAVTRPVLYLTLRKWEYKVAVCSVVWIIIFLSNVPAIVGAPQVFIILLTCVISICTFVVMIACLGGVIRSLQQQSPALTQHRKCSESMLKRQAVHNVLVVVVPAVMSYSSILPLTPLFLYLHLHGYDLDSLKYCHAFHLSLCLLRFSVFIGPLLYLSRARKLCCFSRRVGRESGDRP